MQKKYSAQMFKCLVASICMSASSGAFASEKRMDAVLLSVEEPERLDSAEVVTIEVKSAEFVDRAVKLAGNKSKKPQVPLQSGCHGGILLPLKVADPGRLVVTAGIHVLAACRLYWNENKQLQIESLNPDAPVVLPLVVSSQKGSEEIHVCIPPMPDVRGLLTLSYEWSNQKHQGRPDLIRTWRLRVRLQNGDSYISNEDIVWLMGWRERYFSQWYAGADAIYKELLPGVAGAADPDIKGAFIKGAFADAVGLITPEPVQGIASGVVNGLSQVDEEVERAHMANSWQNLSGLMAAYQRAFRNQLVKSENDVRKELETQYPRLNYSKRRELLDALEQKGSWRIPTVEAIELRLFERWLNSQWEESRFNKGYVDLEWALIAPESNQGEWTLNRCSSAKIVAGVFSERAAARADKFVADKDLASIMSLKVNKRVCFTAQRAKEADSLVMDAAEIVFGPVKHVPPMEKVCEWVSPDNSIPKGKTYMGLDLNFRFSSPFRSNMENGKLTSPVWRFSGCRNPAL